MKTVITQHYLTTKRAFDDKGSVIDESRPHAIEVSRPGCLVGHHYNARQEVLILVWSEPDEPSP